MKEWKVTSFALQPREPKATSFNLAPFFIKSNKHLPVSLSVVAALVDSSSSIGCMRIKLLPSLLQYVFINVNFKGSKRARTGEEVIFFLNL